MRFDLICAANGIEHRLAKPNHPWTNRQVAPMNRTIRDATVKRYHYDDHAQLRVRHAARTNGATCLTLADFLAACNFGRRLKTLGGLTPHDYISKVWTSEPERFIIDPIRQLPGPNTQACSHAGFGRLRHHRQEYPARVSERPDGLQGWRRARATRLPRRRQSPAP